ncbi:unnamed protein product, partial [Polarella glacialis]
EARRRLLEDAEKTGRRIGPRWLGLWTNKFVYAWSSLAGVKLASEGGEGLTALDSSRRYMIVWHPHGFIAWSALFVASRMAVQGHPHGDEWFAMVAPTLFRIPFVSEALMLMNARRVDKKVVENLASRGKSFAIQPGGVREQLSTRHDQEQAIFPANLGFLRVAIRHGIDLLPVYIFGENQTFRNLDGYEKATDLLYKKTKFSLPVVTGKFGMPGLMPVATDIHVRWGLPLEVGPADENPSEERVEALFCRYLAALRRIFRLHAQECLGPALAAKGLKIIRLDGKPVPPNEVFVPSSRL